MWTLRNKNRRIQDVFSSILLLRNNFHHFTRRKNIFNAYWMNLDGWMNEWMDGSVASGKPPLVSLFFSILFH
jgi:hypothetical protein